MSDTFRLHRNGEIAWLTIPLLEDTGLVQAAFSTREGGHSLPPYDGLNLSWSRGDEDDTVNLNYRAFCGALGADPKKTVFSWQVHGTDVLEPDAAQPGLLPQKGQQAPKGDSWITDIPDVLLWRTFADCTPVWLLDPVHKAVAMVHAGWRGAVTNIVGITLGKMAVRFGTEPRETLAAVGPTIGPCCFTIREDVAIPLSLWKRGAFVSCREGQLYGDLPGLVKYQLTAAGISSAHIAVSGLCTSCREDLFFSHRRDRGNCGAMAGVIRLL